MFNWFRSFLSFAFLALFLFLPLLVLAVSPIVAFAQEVGLVADDGDGGGLPTDQIALYGFIVLALIELARRVVAVIPGKPGSAIIGTVEGLVRNLLDFLAGQHGDPTDPSLVKKE